MANNITDKYCVRIKCNGIVGSGVLFSNEETFYVLTAAHCFGATIPDINNIIIEKQDDYASPFNNIKSTRIVEFNLEHDFALIEIDFAEEKRLLYQYKLGRGVLSNNEVKFCGYQAVNIDQHRPFEGKILSISDDKGKFKVTLVKDTFDQAGESGHTVAKGLSGSGVFIYRHNSPFLIGILNSVFTNKAWNDDIDCCSIKHLEKYITEYVDLSDFENLKKWNENLEIERTGKEIENFKKENNGFFEKLYGKNKVLYPDIEQANKVTTKQIRKFLAMRENIRTIEDEYPMLYSKFKTIVKRYVDQVEDDYSRSVNESKEAIDIKMRLQTELKEEFKVLPEFTNIDLSEFQIIEWLGICTLNFTLND
ncbi:hypothetical protein [Pedobacter gandavensis]|uniref:hypothetical protein n=1 Tax=Pedobacter gandavensis TaxID=2679963 RepID=UPI00293111A0|nr:hypothetical protein [Pedobacter gandavensis]